MPSSKLTDFYRPDGKASKNAWDAERAREAEYSLITERLLNMVGGSAGRLRRPEQKVAIGIGLGRFSSNIRLSSLDSSFASYFVQKVSVRVIAQTKRPPLLNTNNATDPFTIYTGSLSGVCCHWR